MQELTYFLFGLIGLAALAGTVEHYRNIWRLRALARQLHNRLINKLLIAHLWIAGLIVLKDLYTYGTNVQISTEAALWVYIPASVSALLLIMLEYRPLDAFREYKKTILGLLSVITLGITLLAGTVVNAAIAHTTGLNANQLPDAQSFLLLLVAPVLWLFFLSFVANLVYFPYTLLQIARIFRPLKYIAGLYGSLAFLLRKKRSPVEDNDDRNGAVILGLYIFILLTWQGLPSYLKSPQFHSTVTSLIVFSSYTSPNGHCQNTQGDNMRIAFLKGERISAAVKREDGTYDFYLDECVRPPSKRLPSAGGG